MSNTCFSSSKALGSGLGAAVLADGRLNVVAGPLFAQIERERADGPRWIEAIKGGRRFRAALIASLPIPHAPPTALEREMGVTGESLDERYRQAAPAPVPAP